VIIANNIAGGVVTMSGVDPSLTIPALSVSQADGDTIKTELGTGVEATLEGIARDGDFDNGVIIHEYGHGVSNRLTGGPGTASCLGNLQSKGMGEGWSDFWALALTGKPGEDRTDPRGIGTYATGGSAGQGLRSYPYSTDLAINPLTLANLPGTGSEHRIGEIWAATLWEMYWNLVDAHGFDADFHGGNGGNNTALQLVMDGLKTQDCNPSFTHARTKIVEADEVWTGGQNKCRVWNAFAKRGMGEGANSGDSNQLTPSTSFALPIGCQVCGDVDDDEDFDLVDLVIAQRAQALAGPGMVGAEKCNVSGSIDLADANLDGVPDDCGSADILAMREELIGAGVGISPVCASANGVFP
jgi:extracellular elastinolytic metalloproteinase